MIRFFIWSAPFPTMHTVQSAQSANKQTVPMIQLRCRGGNASLAQPSSTDIIAQIDSGANISTTNQASILWNIHKLDVPRDFQDAGQTTHTALFRGSIVVPCANGENKPVLAYYTPSINATIISPNAICTQYRSVKHYTTCMDVDNESGAIQFKNIRQQVLFTMPITTINGLHWTGSVIRPNHLQKQSPVPMECIRSLSLQTSLEHFPDHYFDEDDIDALLEYINNDDTPIPVVDANEPSSHSVNQLKIKAQCQLYHQRLGHLNHRSVSELHHHVDGVPHLPIPSIIDSCPVCIAAKLRKSHASSQTSRVATQCFQGIGIDMGFVVQQSKNTQRYQDSIGINGETCYIAITDHHSGMVFGKPLTGKTVPIDWLNNWLSRYAPDVPNKTVRMDQGHELGRSKAVCRLLEQHGYTIELTGADASHQNGTAERTHETIGNMMRSLLLGASLPKKFWPYAFSHCLFLMNRVLHDGKDAPPITLCSGERISLAGLRTFGCRVYVKLPGLRESKLSSNNRLGLFMGYHGTMRNIQWYDEVSQNIKIATHFRFDEGMSDLAVPPPNVKILQRLDDNLPVTPELVDVPSLDLAVDPSPFRILDTITIPIKCEHSTFGIIVGECHIRRRAYISDVTSKSSASLVRNFRNKYIGAFIVEVGGLPVYDVDDAALAFQQLAANTQSTSFTMVVAPDKYIPVRDRRDHMSINIDQLRHITELVHDLSPAPSITNLDISECVHTMSVPIAPIDDSESITGPDISPHVASPITQAEQSIASKLTRRKLQLLDTWHLWQQSERLQLDKMYTQEMFAPPVHPPPDAIILNPIWNYYIKDDGTRKARQCCDGSPRAAPYLHEIAVTYASCIDQPVSRLFYGLSVHFGLTIVSTDAVNAFANADAPSIPTYLRVDAAYSEWYADRFGIQLERNMVVEAKHALQGHPESPRLWEEYINRILIDKLGFTNTTHERSIYSGSFNNHRVFITRQVDDIAVAAPTESIANEVIAAIGQYVSLDGTGLVTKFNGVDVDQTETYLRIHCSTYIDKVLATHGWDTPTQDDNTAHEPLPASMIKQIDIEQGPLEHSPAAKALETDKKFKYRQLLGELMYAHVTCRMDIGYVLTKLAQFSQYPAAIHYSCLRRICIYLRHTKDWGIMFWRPKPMPCFPSGMLQPAELTDKDKELPIFPESQTSNQLVGYVDAAHATDILTRRSVTGFIITFCGAAICYRSKTQTTVATSSTEAEFIAAVTASKAVKYLRSILEQLGCPQVDPTPIYEDNEAAIEMINAFKPTPRARHIDIQFFAIQQWKQNGEVLFHHIPGTINMADALTKALGWILHTRHVRRAMGHYLPAYMRSPLHDT
jgi:Reverse transcriptase (RNA-dependent DNA polymerase)